MNARRTKKHSYSLREVSQITSLKAYLLRYWETEFEELRPKQDRHGNRSYRMEDVKLVFLLKKLLYEEKYTLEGARQRLKAMAQNGQQMGFSFERLRQEDTVFEIKKGLQEILTLLDQHETAPASVEQHVTVVEAPRKRKAAKRKQREPIVVATESATNNGMFSSSAD